MRYRKYLLLFGAIFFLLVIWKGSEFKKRIGLETNGDHTVATGSDDRFQIALSRNETTLQEQLAEKNTTKENLETYLRAFKAERALEVWIKKDVDQQWQLLKVYPFCQFSGMLGPKRKEGDLQIPEGIYHVDRFNPKSNFHLSLGLNYPNTSDRTLGDPTQPGSDIFIHGGCQTVGCIPITDDGIEELYILASWAKANGQDKIPVHIFPFRFTATNWSKYNSKYPEHATFWQQLAAINQQFEKENILPQIKTAANGDYILTMTER